MPKQGKIDAYFRRSTFGEDVRQEDESRNKTNTLVGQSDITLQEFKEFSNVTELITADIKQRRPERYRKELKKIDIYIEQVYKKFITSTNCWKNKFFKELKFCPKPWLTKADLALLRELDINPCYVNMSHNNFVPDFVSLLIKKSDRLHGIEAREKIKLNLGFYLEKMISENVTRLGSLDKALDYIEQRCINKYKDRTSFKKIISEKPCPLSKKHSGFNFEKPCPLSKKKYIPEIENKTLSAADNKPCPLSKKKCTSNRARPCSPVSSNKPCPLSKKKYTAEIESTGSSADNKPCPLSKKKYNWNIAKPCPAVSDDKPCPLSKKKYSLNIAGPCSSDPDDKPCPLSKKRRTSNIVSPCSPISNDNSCPLSDKTSNFYSNHTNTKKLAFDEISRQFIGHCTITSTGTAPEVELNKIGVNRKFNLENLPENNHLSRITHRNSPFLDNESNSYSNSSHAESYPTVINAKTRKFITNEKVAIEKTVKPDDFSNLKIINQSDLLQIIKSRYPYLSNHDKHIVLQEYLKAVLFNFDAVKNPIDELKGKGSKGLDCKFTSKTSEHKSKIEHENIAVSENYPWPPPKLLSFSDFIKYTNVEDYLRADIMRRFPKDYKKYLKQLPKCIKNFYKNIFWVKNEWPPGLKFNTSDLKEFYAANKHNVHSNNNNNNIIIEPSTCTQDEQSSHRTPRNNNPQSKFLREDNLPENVYRNQDTNAPMLIGSCTNEDPKQSEENFENEPNYDGNRSEVLCHNLEKFLTVSNIEARKEIPSIKTSTKGTVETEIPNRETVQIKDTTPCNSKSVQQKPENESKLPQNLIKSRNHIVLDRIHPKSLTFEQFKERTNIEEYIRKDILKKFPETSQKYLPKMQKLIKKFYKKFFIKFPTFPEGLIYTPIRQQNRIITSISPGTNDLAEKNNNIEDIDETMMILRENLDPNNANLDPSDNHVSILRPTEPSQDLFSCSDKSQIDDIIFISCRDSESQVPLTMTDPLNIPENNIIIEKKNNDIFLSRSEHFEEKPEDMENIIENNSVDKVLITGTDKSDGIMTEIHDDITIKQEYPPISLSYKEDVEIILTVTPPPIVIEDSLVDADDYLAEMLLNSQDKSQYYDENNIVLPPASVPSELLNFPIEISTSSEQQNNEIELDTCEKTNQVVPVRNKNLTIEINPENGQIEHRAQESDSNAETNHQTAALLNSCNRNGNNSSFNSKPQPKTSNDNLSKNILEATDNKYKCVENKESNCYNKQVSTQHLNVKNIENMNENATQHLNEINIENIPDMERETTTTKLPDKQTEIASLEKEQQPTSSSNKYNNYKVYSNRCLNLNVQKPNPIKQLKNLDRKNQITKITQNESYNETKETTDRSSKFIDNRNSENNESKKSSIVPKKRIKLVDKVEIPSKRRKVVQQLKKKCKENGCNSDRLDEAVSNKDFVSQTKHNFGPLALIQKKITCIATTDNNCQAQASLKIKKKSNHSSNEDPDYRIDDASQISTSQFLNSDNTYFTSSDLGTEHLILIKEKGLTPDKSTSPARISTESIPTSSFTRAATMTTYRKCPEPAGNVIIKLLKPIRPPTQFGCITYVEISKIILNSKPHRMYYDSSIPFIQQFEKHPLKTIMNIKGNGFRQLNICGSCVRLMLGFTVKEWSCVDNDEAMITFSENLDQDNANLDPSDNHGNILRPIIPSQDPFNCSDNRQTDERIFVSCGDCESQVQLSVIDPLNFPEQNVICDIRISLPRNEHFQDEPDEMEHTIGNNSIAEVILTDTDKTISREDISIKQECPLISSSYKEHGEIILPDTPLPISIENSLEDADDYLAQMLINSQGKSQCYDENNIVLPPASVPFELLNSPIEISTSSEQQNNERELDNFETTNQVDPIRNKNLKIGINPENNIDLSEQIKHRAKQSDSDPDTNPETPTLLNSCNVNGKNSSFNSKSSPNVHEFEDTIEQTSQQSVVADILNELSPDEQTTSLSVFGNIMTTTKISKDMSVGKICNDHLSKDIVEDTSKQESKTATYCNKEESTQPLHVINIENMPEKEPATATKLQNEQNKIAPLEKKEHPNSSSNEYSNHEVYYNLRLNLNLRNPNANNQLKDIGIKNQTTTITQNDSYNETSETKMSSIELVPKKRPKLVQQLEKPLKRRKMEQSHKICNENDGNTDRADEDASNKDFVPQTKHNFGPLALIQKKINCIATTDDCHVQASMKTKQKSDHSTNEDPDYQIDDSSQISISQFLNSDNTYFTGSQLGTEERILITEKSLTPNKSTSSAESTPAPSFTRAITPTTDKKCPEPAENGIIKLLKPIRPATQFGCITYLAISKIILNSKINRMYYDSSIPFLQPFEKQPLQATVNFKSNGFRQLNICGNSVRLLLGFTVKELSCVIKILKIIDTFKYEPINPEPTNESLPYRILYYLFKTIPKFSQVYFEYEDHNINYVKCVSINNNNTTSYKPISCLTKIIDNDILDEIKKLKQKLNS